MNNAGILALLVVVIIVLGICELTYRLDPASWYTQTTVVHGHCLMVTTRNWLGAITHVQRTCT